MRSTVLAFWLGAAASFVAFILTAAATTFDVRVTAGDAEKASFVQHVDQGALSRLLAPAALTIGSLHFTKRGWGVMTTYTEDLTVAAGALSAHAGAPVDLRITLSAPGRVVATNATGREGDALVWVALPVGEPLHAETRAVNWPFVTLLAAGAAASLPRAWSPRRAREAR